MEKSLKGLNFFGAVSRVPLYLHHSKMMEDAATPGAKTTRNESAVD